MSRDDDAIVVEELSTVGVQLSGVQPWGQQSGVELSRVEPTREAHEARSPHRTGRKRYGWRWLDTMLLSDAPKAEVKDLADAQPPSATE